MAKKEKEANKKQKGHFFKDMKAELKKVIWPTPKQTANNTLAVIAFTLILAVIVFVLDVCFDVLNKKGVVALQEKVKSSYSSNVTNNTTEGNTTDENATNSENADAQNATDENATEVKAEATTDGSSDTESKE